MYCRPHRSVCRCGLESDMDVQLIKPKLRKLKLNLRQVLCFQLFLTMLKYVSHQHLQLYLLLTSRPFSFPPDLSPSLLG